MMFGFSERPNMPPRYNIAPTQPVATVRQRREGAGRELAMARWGLVPRGFKGDKPAGKPLTIARAETIATKWPFAEPYKRHRCVILADGFYEWQEQPGSDKRLPYHVRLRSREPFGLAAIWDRWKGPDGEVESCAVVTTEANALMQPIHDRMPVVLDPADYDRWLDPARPGASDLLRPCPPEWLEAYPVDARVGSYKNDDPSLIEPWSTVDKAG